MTEKRLDTANKDKHGGPEWTRLLSSISAVRTRVWHLFDRTTRKFDSKIASEYRSGYLSWRCEVKSTRKQSYLERKFGWNICDMYTTSRGKRYLLNITAAIFGLLLILVSLLSSLTLISLYRNDYIISMHNFR